MNTDKTSIGNESQPSCLGAVSGSLRDNLINHYDTLLTKNHKYQMGDDDYELSTAELTICRALTVILNDLKNCH